MDRLQNRKGNRWKHPVLQVSFPNAAKNSPTYRLATSFPKQANPVNLPAFKLNKDPAKPWISNIHSSPCNSAADKPWHPIFWSAPRLKPDDQAARFESASACGFRASEGYHPRLARKRMDNPIDRENWRPRESECGGWGWNFATPPRGLVGGNELVNRFNRPNPPWVFG